IRQRERVHIQTEPAPRPPTPPKTLSPLKQKVPGRPGTAMTEANEFSQIYKLGVVPIPTNMPMIRADHSDMVYQTAQAKFDAVADDLVERYEVGQPVLVGTTSVEKSEVL